MWRHVVLLAALAAAASSFSLQGHSVLRVVPETAEQLDALHDFLENNPSLDVWALTRILGRPVDVSVTPSQRRGLEYFLQSQGLQYEELISDLHSFVQAQALTLRAGADDGSIDWNNYYRLDQIHSWLAALEKKHPGVASVVDAGKSLEGRSIKGLKIAFGENKPIIMVESGIHAREWIAPASATYFINQTLNSAPGDVIRNFEWHIFPVVNPDGYDYTWTTNRHWRKTRSSHWFIFHGVDPNRNWPFHWMEAGANRAPWTELYGGPKAESEVETRNLRAYLDSMAERMHVYISLHSYSQLLMFPWGYTSDKSATHDKLNSIAGKAVSAIRDVHGTVFRYGNIADAIYPASGNTIDYAYSKCVPFPFVFELRDTGKYGFMLPADQILPTAEETWAGIRVIVQEADRSGVPFKNKC